MTQSFKLWKLAAMGVAVVALAGCGTSGNLLGNAEQPSTTAAAETAKTAQKVATNTVSFAPIVGAPETVGKPLIQKIAAAAGQRNIQVAASGQPSNFVVRGYVVAAPTNGGSKLSYIWDVFDAAGKRQKRFVGEEVIPGRAGTDPWSTVSPAVLDKIAASSATQLASYTPMVAGAAAPPAAPASPAVPAQLTPTTPANPVVAGGPTIAPTPASVNTPVLAVVPAVLGAPGDGRVSLTNALRKELAGKGVALAKSPSGQTYTVQGTVSLGAVQGKSQDIKIDWVVRAPSGEQVGTVTQKNAVPRGSLDKRWGPVATAAAGAAAQGILKLLPPRNQ